MMASRPERVIGHIGTEIRPRLLRRQQWGILHNGRKSDAATPRGGLRFSDCKLLLRGKKELWLISTVDDGTSRESSG